MEFKSLALALFAFTYVSAANAGSLTGHSTEAHSRPPGNGVCPFQEQTSFFAPENPTYIASGDVNGDGILDLVVTGLENLEEQGGVSVYLGIGDGSFQPRRKYLTGEFPYGVALADFNNDSHLDIAAIDKLGTFDLGLAILLNNGDGTFQPRMRVSVEKHPISVTTGDFNQDGNADVLVADNDRSELSLLLGNGDGTFKPQTFLITANSPQAVTVGDFNGDGKLDIAATVINSLDVFLGNGDGTFQPRVDYPLGKNGFGIVAADVDGNGTLDLLVADGTLRVFLGVGDGTFLPPQEFHAGTFPTSPVVADFNQDGKLDVALGTHDVNSRVITILPGRGDGRFGAPISCAVSREARSITVGDFNLDGAPDVAALYTLFSGSVLLNSGKQ